MNSLRIDRFVLAVALGLCFSAASVGADEFGHIKGRVVFDGAVPDVKVIVREGDNTARDAEVCAAHTIIAESIVVNPKDKGVANVFVYLRKASVIHPQAAAVPTGEIVFMQKGCRFEPHAVFARVGQVIRIQSSDPISHNVHTFPVRNDGQNFITRPNETDGTALKLQRAESTPFPVRCDVHPWMASQWLVLDHPYAAITDENGEFEIQNLPVGEQEFRVWHERVGYVDRSLKINVVAGTTTDIQALKIASGTLKPE